MKGILTDGIEYPSSMINDTHREQPSHLSGIAVIGMAGRFPGAHSAEAFWENLSRGVSGISAVAPQRNRDSALPDQPNYVARCAVVKDADRFDAAFFGIYPKQAQEMDPQHRLFLEVCWHAMEDAGYVPDETRNRVGVFAGCHMNTYIFTRLAADAKLRASLADSFPGGSLVAEISNDKDYIATRVAYQLNLRGPSVAVQTACSTSLVAIAQACQSLESEACDMALAGGVTLTFPQEQGYLYTEDSILSPDGCCRTFDARAQGTIFGDGVGAIVLKRVEDAIADGDGIYAVIKGWGVNNDGGSKPGYTAPSIEGQSRAIALAHQKAGISADTISYVEAHGTGTQVGDPIEIAALTQAFRQTTDKKQFCRIGSLKTNVGHLDVAAGVAGVIKTCFALTHQMIPPSLNFESPNPKIDFPISPFVVNTEPTRWEPKDGPRRAGISAFGVGGTNAHLVIEEAPINRREKSRRDYHLLRLSARSSSALDEATGELARYLADHPDLDLADVGYTLQTGRKAHRHRRIVVARTSQEAAQSLQAGSSSPARTSHVAGRDTPVVFMFPGQGSQHLDMARDLTQMEPVFAEHLDACAQAFLPHLNVDLRCLIFPTSRQGAAERLDQTDMAQPALFMVSYALAKWWQSRGVHPTAMVGHSVGEFTAAAVAKVMSLQDAAELVATRGRLMQQLPPGAMLAVRLPESRLQPLLGQDLEIAAVNGPEMCVVSGPASAVSRFAGEVESGKHGEDIVCRPLRTSHAFHSRMMDPAIEPFAQVVRGAELRAPEIPVISSVTASDLNASVATDPNYWARQIREPVRFSTALSTVLDRPQVVLLEVGPGQALSTLARGQPLDPRQHHVLASLPHAKDEKTSATEAVLTTLGRLWLAGANVDWQAVYADERRQRLHLPKYPFERSRHWFEVETDAPEHPGNSGGRVAGESLTEEPSNGRDETREPSRRNRSLPMSAEDCQTGGDFAQQVVRQQLGLMHRQIELLRAHQKMDY